MGTYMSVERALADYKKWRIGGRILVRGRGIYTVTDIRPDALAVTGTNRITGVSPYFTYYTVVNGVPSAVDLAEQLPGGIDIDGAGAAGPVRVGGRRTRTEIGEERDEAATEEKIRKSSANGRPPPGIDGDIEQPPI